ncbi:acyl-CoA dehydrogenase family protein [Actinophytocola oryzae]|uniref:Alkylation response protein AidB-like acyl-CoA dehydrogenase n=1 Tax=Actinophytocola oryzae TaxID=502181 RepID=A0A4R7W0H1_9PSEU|nr:alkylation response protein AidB-like acyl-CoA dehydrogenase [Actinophytocola oryzae]
MSGVAEHDQLRATLREFVADHSPSSAVRRWMDAERGHDPVLWRRFAGELGLTGIAVPESYGGAGGGPVELGIVLEELGRALVPSPFFATVAMAGQALVASGDEEARSRWLPGIADGSLTATLAVTEETGSWQLDDLATVATRHGLVWTVSGTKMFVVDGHTADLLLVVANTAEQPALFAVEPTAAGVTRTRLDTLDPTRRLGRVDLDGAPAVRIRPSGPEFLRTVLDLVLIALAAEQVGGAQACLDAAVAYAKLRVQFDRPIGSFQAVKHKCADLLLRVESARSAARHAAAVTAGGSDETSVVAAVAAGYCAAAFTHAAKENIQLHGGIGYTWEHDAHLYLRRAKSSELLHGAPPTHRARLADLLAI